MLAAAGVGSRRACEELIAAGRVSVDGRTVTGPGLRVDPATAVVHVDGARVNVRSDLVYLALNKPRGVLSAMSDTRGRPTIAQFVADRPERLFHVGRLDGDSEGLLLLTNDGELAHRLMHPAFGVAKTYLATVPGPVARDVARRLRAGIVLDDGPVRVDAFRVVQTAQHRAIVEVVLHEGRKHIVRRLLDAVGHPVQRLVRTAIGPVRLGSQRAGTVRELTRAELAALHATVADAADEPGAPDERGHGSVRQADEQPGTRTTGDVGRFGVAGGVFAGVVALDGPSGTGKSTVARALAVRLGARYLDTGAMYRAATLAVLRAHVPTDDATRVLDAVAAADIDISTDPEHPAITLDGTPVDAEIRGAEVTAAVSAVSAQPDVRTLIVRAQRGLIDGGQIVVEGRDIGTVVWPDAKPKVFLTASAATRARRRSGELPGSDLAGVAADIERRDRLDSTRAASPLYRADDAIELDTTELDVAQVVERIIELTYDREPRYGRDV